MKVYDYRCKTCGNIFEEFVRTSDCIVRCKCGSTDTVRMPSNPRSVLDGASGDFPGEHMKWVREHEKAAKKNRDAE